MYSRFKSFKHIPYTVSMKAFSVYIGPQLIHVVMKVSLKFDLNTSNYVSFNLPVVKVPLQVFSVS